MEIEWLPCRPIKNNALGERGPGMAKRDRKGRCTGAFAEADGKKCGKGPDSGVSPQQGWEEGRGAREEPEKGECLSQHSHPKPLQSPRFFPLSPGSNAE